MRFYMVRDMNNIPADNSVRIGQRAWDDNDQTVFMFRQLNRISIRCEHGLQNGWRTPQAK